MHDITPETIEVKELVPFLDRTIQVLQALTRTLCESLYEAGLPGTHRMERGESIMEFTPTYEAEGETTHIRLVIDWRVVPYLPPSSETSEMIEAQLREIFSKHENN